MSSQKKSWGDLRGCWVAHDVRDAVVDFVKCWSRKVEIPVNRFLAWLGSVPSKYYAWQDRYGKANEHNRPVPRDFWLESGEKEAIIAFHGSHPLEGYRRLTFMMLDADVVAVCRIPTTLSRPSPSSADAALTGRPEYDGPGSCEGDGAAKATPASGRAQAQGLNTFQLATAAGNSISNRSKTPYRKLLLLWLRSFPAVEDRCRRSLPGRDDIKNRDDRKRQNNRTCSCSFCLQ